MNTIICRPRGGGKTTEIIKEVLAHDGVLFVLNYNLVKDIERNNPLMRGRVFTWDNRREALRARKNKKCFIDDAEIILQHELQAEILGLTLSIGY